MSVFFKSFQIKKTINSIPGIVPNPVKARKIPKNSQNLFKIYLLMPRISF